VFCGWAAHFYSELQEPAKKQVIALLNGQDHPTLKQLAAALQAGPLFAENFWVNPLTKGTEGRGQ